MFRSLSPRSWPRTLLLMTESSTYSPVLSLVRELVQAAIDPARKPTRMRVSTRRSLFNTVCLHIHREAGRAHDLPGSAFHQAVAGDSVADIVPWRSRRSAKWLDASRNAASRSVYFLLIVSRTVSFMLPTAF